MFKPRILIGLLLALSSCASDNSDMPRPSKEGPTAVPGNAKPQVPDNVPRYRGTSMVAPPPGALFTIFAGRIEGDAHVLRANRLRDQLIASTGMKDWYIVHEATHSALYYGYYRNINDEKDKAESSRAQLDRAKIDLMTDPMGNRPFRQALFVEIDTPDPQARPEWNLANAKGEFTVQIAVYKSNTGRKQAAVEAVAAARAQGIEAYYYHGEMASLVCVGAWPQTAVKVTDNVRAASGSDPMQPLLVVPMTNDPEMNRQFDKAASDAGAQLVKQQVQILDPTLQATFKQFPHNSVNGMEMKHTVGGREQYESSLLRRIPHDAPEALMANREPATPGQPGYDPSYRPQLPRTQDAPPPQVRPPAQTGGRLRGIGG